MADGHRVGLTVREYQLFAALASRPNRVMQRSEIFEIVWGGTIRHRDRSVDVVVRKIRDKLEQCVPDWRYIHTHFGVGYRFNPERITAETGRNAGAGVERAAPGPSRAARRSPDAPELRAG